MTKCLYILLQYILIFSLVFASYSAVIFYLFWVKHLSETMYKT